MGMKVGATLFAVAAADTCSLWELADGTCADQGYTIKTGTQTKTYPIIGDIVITTYDQGFKAMDTCSLWEIADGSCGQSDLSCAYVKYAKAAEKALADGTCADQ